jgi:hypothetical protein
MQTWPYILSTRSRVTRLGDYLFGHFLKNDRNIPQFWATCFQSIDYVFILASFWAILSQTHLVTLTRSDRQQTGAGETLDCVRHTF